MEIKDQLIAIMDGEYNICAEVDQTLYKKPGWAVDQIVRASGLVEDICECGVGHPNSEYLKRWDPDGSLRLGIHGCCENSCCNKQ